MGFHDTTGFNAYAEKHAPKEVIGVLSGILGPAAAIIYENKGDVDKFRRRCVFRTNPRQCSGAIPATVPEQYPPAFRTNVRHPFGVTPPLRDRTNAGGLGAVRPS